MATVVKDFKIKSGLIVEGTSGTINGYDILTKKTADQNYIIGLIGGAATSEATPDTVVLRDENGDFSANVVTADLVGDVTGNADTATALETSRTIELTGDVTGSVSFDGTANVQISTTLDGSFATDAEVATAKGEAITAAGDYTDQEISDLDASLKLYADQAEADAISAAALDATTKADQAEADAIAAAALDATTKANAAEAAAKLYADGLAVNYDEAGAADAALVDAKAYTDAEVAALVDGAPALLDTLNELAAAIADNPNYATDVANLVASKADTTYVDDEIAAAIQATTYTAGTNIDITGNVVSVTGLDSADISDFNTAAVSANTGLWDTIGAASTAETNAKSYADGLAVNYDAAGSASAAQTAAETFATNAINALDTDDIEEGSSNLYYTTGRAKTDAAALLVGATLTNIQITGDGNGLTITAENGVADSDTDDLAEGTSNLYFTDQRAVDALQNTDSVFNTVSIDEVALQVAATLSAPTAGIQSAYTWNTADYTSAEFLVKVAYGTHTEVSKVLLTLDTSSNIAITEYAIVGTNGSASTISASVADGVVSLDVTTNNNNSTVTVVGTLLV
jgi:hypothetical protein